VGGRPRAFALIVALVTTTAVFAAAMSLSLASRSATVEAGALSRALEQEFGARTAATRAVIGLLGVRTETQGGGPSGGSGGAPAVDTDDLPEMPEFLREFLEGQLDQEDDEPSGGGASSSSSDQAARSRQTLRARGLPLEAVRVEADGAWFRVELTDALGGLELNSANEEELRSVLESVGIAGPAARSIAAELIDYRDPDDFVTPGGAEGEAYGRRGLTIKNAPLATARELLFLPSMTPETFRALRPLVCVGGSGKIHVPTAPPELLAALPGMTDAAVSEIVALREAGELDRASLKEALPLFAKSLESRLGVEPSPVIRARVSAEAGGPVFEGLAAVTDEGVRWLQFGVE